MFEFQLEIQFYESEQGSDRHRYTEEELSFVGRDKGDRYRKEQHELPADIALNSFGIFFKYFVFYIGLKVGFFIDP